MASSAAVAAAIALGIISVHGTRRASGAAAASAPPTVEVSNPLQRSLDTQLKFLGQYSAVDRVELRAQVGGTLSEIHFKDGDIVHKGDLLFVIDQEPYQIRLSQAKAQLEAANVRFDLATRELARAQARRPTPSTRTSGRSRMAGSSSSVSTSTRLPLPRLGVAAEGRLSRLTQEPRPGFSWPAFGRDLRKLSDRHPGSVVDDALKQCTEGRAVVIARRRAVAAQRVG